MPLRVPARLDATAMLHMEFQALKISIFVGKAMPLVTTMTEKFQTGWLII